MIENQITVAEFSGASELKALAHGLATRRVVKFDYRKPGQDTSQQRSLEPWGMALRSGSWYVYGFDRDRQGPRCFNLSRITSSVSAVAKAQSFEIPENVDVNELLNPSQSNAAAISVKLKIASGSGHYWLERAQQVSDSGGDYEVTVALTTPRLQIPRLAADAPGVVVLEPQDIRQEVISLIQGAL
jgi:predicted DNA-binding transcriptional regulator YafY